jgi:hypothetical protein
MEEEVDSVDESDSWAYPCQYDREKAEEQRRKEEEEMRELVAEKKRRQNDPLLHCEGETDIEDIYDCEEQDIRKDKPVKKKVKKQGPTLRSHSQVEKETVKDWAPSDEEEEQGFLKEEEDDFF